MSQTVEVISQCKQRIAARMQDTKDEVIVSLWKSLVEAMDLNVRIQRALDDINRGARDSAFADDIAATRIVQNTTPVPKAIS